MTEQRHTADTITDDALDQLYAERDRLREQLDSAHRQYDQQDALRYAFTTTPRRWGRTAALRAESRATLTVEQMARALAAAAAINPQRHTAHWDQLSPAERDQYREEAGRVITLAADVPAPKEPTT